MNAKSKIAVKMEKGIIEVNTVFAKMMMNALSDEYAVLQKVRRDYPEFHVQTRKINTNPKKDTYKGLTYDYMRSYIVLHTPEAKRDEVIAELDDLIFTSKCHRISHRYPTIKKWFLEKYPAVAKFGITEFADSEQECGMNTQKVIAMPSVDEIARIGESRAVEQKRA